MGKGKAGGHEEGEEKPSSLSWQVHSREEKGSHLHAREVEEKIGAVGVLASELEQADHGLEAAAVRVEGGQLGEGEAGPWCWATPLGLAGLNGSLLGTLLWCL